MDENLVGYLLKALDDDDALATEAYLRDDPEARDRLERLRQVVGPLAADADEEAPPGLWVRTLARVAEYQCRELRPAPPPRLTHAPPPSRRGWRPIDALVAAGILFCAVGLVLPAVYAVWQRHQVNVCQNNLRLFHNSLVHYSENHSGALPKVERNGAMGFAGVFIPLLHKDGVLDDRVSVDCSSKPRPPSSKTLEELQEMWEKKPDDFRALMRDLAGCYAYTLGYCNERGDLCGLSRNSGDDAHMPVMADAPPEDPGLHLASGNSRNHGGRGQNVLYLDGSVRFSPERGAGPNGDDIYVNQDGKLAAGRHRWDAVLGPSWARALPGGDDD